MTARPSNAASPPGPETGRGGELLLLGGVAAAEAIRHGAADSRELVQACLDRIALVDPEVEAWIRLDPEHALAQARAADDARGAGRALGRLHGVPVAVKDIFDTADYPTENGTVLHAGRAPDRDATAVARLRAAGAIVIGKSVTTELAMYTPGKTRNPQDHRRTPGGSSSGSAAAVAAWMVPLALGSQTNGSVIRPAAFCGVIGFKPTHGLISRHRVLALSRALDHVGVFARSVEDAALVAECLIGFDEHDPDTRPMPAPALLETARSQPPAPPRLAFARTPAWGLLDTATRAGFEALVAGIAQHVEEVALAPEFDHAVEWHRTIMEADLARSLARELAHGGDRLSGRLREMLERGRRALALDYNDALGRIESLNASLEAVLATHDALITPATRGEAPLGLESTGDPVCCTPWTLCGTPAISLPLLTGESGMPIGVQLVGRRGDDARLLRTARWVSETLAG